MAGLVLTLKPNEKFLVNGALLENGPKRGQIRVSDSDVNVLRLSDALHPSEVNTPMRRVYYAAQLILTGDVDEAVIAPEIVKGLEALRHVFEGLPEFDLIDKASTAAQDGKYYSILCALKPIFPIEEAMLLRGTKEAAGEPPPILQQATR